MAIPFNELEFSTYLKRCKKAIIDLHAGAPHSLRNKAVKSNSPYEVNVKKAKHGIILIHGLLDSPFAFLSVEQHLSQSGYWVKNLLLDGHGLSPDKLFKTHYQHWIYQVLMAIDSFDSTVETISLIGYSTGSLLALHAAMSYPEKINSLILFCPAFKLRHLPQYFLPLIYPFRRFIPWAVHREEDNYAKYRSVATNAAYQVRQLGVKIRNSLKQNPKLPKTFMVLSEDDETISFKAALNEYEHLKAIEKKLYLYTNSHQFDKKASIVKQSCFPEERILNFSHVGLANDAKHPLYGKANAPQGHYLGALSAKNLSFYHPLSRNTFNPDFDNLISQIHSFITN